MSEALSTLSIPLKWAAKEERKNELLQTGFFLFHDGEGRVVVREPAEMRDTNLESRTPVTSSPSVTDAGERSSAPAKVARVPQTRVLRGSSDQRYILLKKYEGFVTARSEDSFSARLFENHSDYPVVEAEFDLEELSETDRKLVVEGAAMVWTIGYAYDGNTRKRESLIYLRRLPAWNDKELEQGRKAAEALTSAIKWE
jgi:hypothetical protein